MTVFGLISVFLTDVVPGDAVWSPVLHAVLDVPGVVGVVFANDKPMMVVCVEAPTVTTVAGDVPTFLFT